MVLGNSDCLSFSDILYKFYFFTTSTRIRIIMFYTPDISLSILNLLSKGHLSQLTLMVIHTGGPHSLICKPILYVIYLSILISECK